MKGVLEIPVKPRKQESESIDCIAMKRKIQREMSRETRGMTPEEKLAYYCKLVDDSPWGKLVRRRRSPRSG
jgi:hypothetical protein